MEFGLTDREKRILELSEQGHNDDEIARLCELETIAVTGAWLRLRLKAGGGTRLEVIRNLLDNSEILAERFSAAELGSNHPGLKSNANGQANRASYQLHP
jgi:DNA-binding CsgD family transcriptional regulator